MLEVIHLVFIEVVVGCFPFLLFLEFDQRLLVNNQRNDQLAFLHHNNGITDLAGKAQELVLLDDFGLEQIKQVFLAVLVQTGSQVRDLLELLQDGLLVFVLIEPHPLFQLSHALRKLLYHFIKTGGIHFS